MPSIADEALSFIDGLSRLTTLTQVIDAIAGCLAKFGIEHFVVTGLPNNSERLEGKLIIRKWPQGWFELYTQENYVRDDPVIRLCRQTVQPFEWESAAYDPIREPRTREVMNRAEDFGMRRGFCLPIHGLHGYEACFSMSGSKLDLSGHNKAAIHLVAMYAFERVRCICNPSAQGGTNPLSQREQEVLRWAANGKAASETAIILGITSRTVTAHTVNAMRKLESANKTQAVASAMQRNLIQI